MGKRLGRLLLVGCIGFVLPLLPPISGDGVFAHHFGGTTEPDPTPEEEGGDSPPCDKKPPCECYGGTGTGTGSGNGSGTGSGPGTNFGAGPNPPPVLGSGGKPVLLWNGAEHYSRTDLVVDGIFPITVARSYDSRSPFDSVLGYGWAFHHDRRLFEYPDDSIVIRHECGKRMRFVQSGGTYVTPHDGPQGELIEHPDGSFEYRFYDGSRDLFDADGRLVAEISKQGHRHEFVYDARGKLALTGTSPHAVNPDQPMVVAHIPRVTRIQERTADGQLTGVYIDFFYDETTGRLERLQTHDGREIYYTHDTTTDGLTKGNLIRVEGLGNLYQVYGYESPHGQHLMTSMQHGQTAEPIVNTYDAEHRVVQQTHGSRQLDFHYEIPKARTRVTRTIRDDQGQELHTADTVVEFDPDGYPTKQIDPDGNETRIFYDGNQDVDRVEWWEMDAGSLTLARTANYTYDAQSRLLSQAVTLDSGETVTHSQTYDEGWVASEEVVSSADPGKVFRIEYTFVRDANGRPTNIATVERPNDDGTIATTTYNYCTESDIGGAGSTCPYAGLIKSVDGPRTDVNDVTNYSYYADTDLSGCGTGGPCHRKGQLWKTTNALGQVTEIVRYDAAGRPVRIMDANGVETELAYHARGWLLSRTVEDPGGIQDAVTSYTYDDRGNVTRITRPDGSFADFTYDARARLVQVSDQLGNEIAYTLDSEGNRLAEETFDSSGVLHRTLSREFDALNRLSVRYDAQGRDTQFDYNDRGMMTRTTDALGTVTSESYDDLGRRVETVQDDGGIGATIAYEYDAMGNLQSVTDPKKLVTSYDYDARGNLVRLDSPDTGVTDYTYDIAGNRVTQTDARDVTTNYSYDALGRMTAVSYPDASLAVAMHYDEPDSVTGCSGSYAVGRLTRVTDASGSTTYCYDHRGNVTLKTQVTEGATLTVAYEYDGADQLTAITYPSGRQVDLTRDGAGRISALTLDGATTLANGFAYLPFGPVAGYTFGNSETLTRTHDQNYWLTDLVSPALELHFGRDALGNISVLGSDPGATTVVEQYEYDALSRITDVDDPGGELIEGYTYDATGNRLTKVKSFDTEPYSYSKDSHRLTAVDGQARTYDAAGNTLTDAGENRSYTYDDRNRLVAANSLTDNGYYQYNARGERVRKTAVTTTLFLYDESGKLLGEYAADGTVRKEYVYADSLIVSVLAPGGTNYVHADHLGSPRAVTDAAGVKVWSWPFAENPFGEAAAEEDPDGIGTAFTFNLRFPGQYYDAETGVHYNYFRDYKPGTGRYIESDPIGLAGGLSTYSYALSNPLNLDDPIGLTPCDLPCMIEVVACYELVGAWYFGSTSSCIALCVLTRGGPRARNPILYLKCGETCTDGSGRLSRNMLVWCLDMADECRYQRCNPCK